MPEHCMRVRTHSHDIHTTHARVLCCRIYDRYYPLQYVRSRSGGQRLMYSWKMLFFWCFPNIEFKKKLKLFTYIGGIDKISTKLVTHNCYLPRYVDRCRNKPTGRRKVKIYWPKERLMWPKPTVIIIWTWTHIHTRKRSSVCYIYMVKQNRPLRIIQI